MALRACLALAAHLAVIAHAEELRIDDLQLDYAPLLGKDVRLYGSIEVNDQSAQTSLVPEHVSSHQRIGLGYYRSTQPLEANRGSFVVGAGLAVDSVRAGEFTGDATMVDVFVGWAWAFTPRLIALGGFMAGVGVEQYDMFTDGNSSFAYEFGVRGGMRYSFEHWQVGLDLTYQTLTAQISDSAVIDTTEGTFAVDFDGQLQIDGFGIITCIAYRF
jgi:hypothetical protein